MGISFSITPSGGSPISFAANAHADGRYAIDINPGSRDYDIKRYHVPGVDGNYIVRCGAKGGMIVCQVRYIGAIATALGYYYADLAAIANKACTIVDDNSNTYTRCELMPAGASKITKPKATGRSGLVYFDAQFAFQRDD